MRVFVNDSDFFLFLEEGCELDKEQVIEDEQYKVDQKHYLHLKTDHLMKILKCLMKRECLLQVWNYLLRNLKSDIDYIQI